MTAEEFAALVDADDLEKIAEAAATLTESERRNSGRASRRPSVDRAFRAGSRRPRARCKR